MLKIYNTLTKRKEEFQPMEQNKVRMFVCGPTVYDHIHIGNARTFVFFDVVARYLRQQGYEVHYVQNITDVDDKIIKRASESDIDPLEWAERYAKEFKQDMENIGVTSARYEPATTHIPEVLAQVNALIKNGNAYEIPDDGWYFDLTTFPEYGKLSGRTAQMTEDGVSRIDDSDKKRNTGDFCLWKFSKPGEPIWNPKEHGFPEIKLGRPGWHIEDTAITEAVFGPQYDLHGAGQDLMFPHHEAEIAQQESVSGKKPFVKYWMHAGFLINKTEKMSKSLGNFSTLHDLFAQLQKHPAETLRFYFLSAHYHGPLNFEESLIKQAEAAVDRIADFMAKLDNASGQENSTIEQALKETADKFYVALNDDFNTPMALGALFELIRDANPLLVKNDISESQATAIKAFFNTVHAILGIIPAPKEQKIPAEVLELVERREISRNAKDWAKADELRAQIESRDFHVDDTAFGPIISQK